MRGPTREKDGDGGEGVELTVRQIKSILISRFALSR